MDELGHKREGIGMKRNIIVGLAALFLMGVTLYQVTLKDQEAVIASVQVSNNAITVGKLVPSFELQGLDGKIYQQNGEREKPLILNFWASWCGPCHEEAPDFSKIYEHYGEKLDLYAVNVTKGDSLRDVKAFVKQYQLTFPVLLDHKGAVAEQYRILFVPTSFLIDKHGVLKEIIHVIPEQQLEQRIKSLINA
jgi:thiol-disulfide isomerase/thioredoxin